MILLVLLIIVSLSKAVSCKPTPDIWFKFDNERNEKVLSERSPQQIGSLESGTSIVTNGGRRVAYFDGKNSGIKFENETAICFATEEKCDKGFTVAFWMKWHKWAHNFVFSSKYFNMRHFLVDIAPVEIWRNGRSFRIFHNRLSIHENVWLHYAIRWDNKCITLYVNGKQIGQDCKGSLAKKRGILQPRQVDNTTFIIGASLEKNDGKPKISFMMDDLKIWRRFVDSKQIHEDYMKGLILSQMEFIEPMVSMTTAKYVDYAFVSSNNSKKLKALSLDDCHRKCYKLRSQCTSFNYQYQSPQRIHTCEINVNRVNTVDENFVKRKNYVFFKVH